VAVLCWSPRCGDPGRAATVNVCAAALFAIARYRQTLPCSSRRHGGNPTVRLMVDWLSKLDASERAVLVAGIGIAGVALGAFLSKSVQARNLEADRKADSYADVWRLIDLLIDTLAAVQNEVIGVKTGQAELAALGTEVDALKAELEAGRVAEADMAAAVAQLADLAERTGSNAARQTRQDQSLEQHRQRVDDFMSKLADALPKFTLTASRLVVYRFGALRTAVRKLTEAETAEGLARAKAESRRLFELWTLTARRDVRATRRGGVRLWVFVARSAWIRRRGR
jgi:hypothetical protein